LEALAALGAEGGAYPADGWTNKSSKGHRQAAAVAARDDDVAVIAVLRFVSMMSSSAISLSLVRI